MLGQDLVDAAHRPPLVSVVMPCYDAAPFLAESIGSCLAQTRPPSEIIVVNDGSTDDSGQIARSLLCNAPFPVQVVDVANGGPSRARNIGWRMARSKWIQFMDADDRLHVDKFAVHADVAQDLPLDVAVVYSVWQRLVPTPAGWSLEPELHLPSLPDPVGDVLKGENFMPLGSLMFRRDWLEEVDGLDESLRMIEDVNLVLRIAMAGGKFHHAVSPTALFYYRMGHEASLVRRGIEEFVGGCVSNARLAESYWRSTSQLTPARRQILAAQYAASARQVFGIDRREFEELVADCQALLPGYIPPGPAGLRRLSRLIGYERAERVAAWYRRVRRTGRGLLSHRQGGGKRRAGRSR